MKFEFLTEDTAVGRLHGMSVGAADDLALHLHGTWGNFYENPFVIELAKTYTELGWRYASVNLPSHDGGSISEQMEESLEAITHWLSSLCRPKGRLIIQGHSLGALKILRALSNGVLSKDRNGLVGTVLLAPFDVVAFNGGKTNDEIERARRIVSDLVSRDTQVLVPVDVFGHWPISGQTFLALTEAGGIWDAFPSRNGNHTSALDRLDMPTLVAIGEDDFAAYPTPPEVLAPLSRLPHVSAHLIPKAPHNFAGQERLLASIVREFITKLQ